MAEGSPPSASMRKGRKTVYKGIEMRSRLEAGYAAWLDGQPCKWEYEPQAFANEHGQYLPDFRIEDVHDLSQGKTSHACVEIKPSFVDIDINAIFHRMAVIWDSEPDAQLLIQCGPERSESVTPVRGLAFRLGEVMAPGVFSYQKIMGSDANGPREFRGAYPMAWVMEKGRGLDGPTLAMPLMDSPWPPGYWTVPGVGATTDA